MAHINPNFRNVAEGYFFSEIGKRVAAFSAENPGVELYRLGIGNTTEALTPAIIRGLTHGVEKLSRRETYAGYGDEQGDARLRKAVVALYAERGISFAPNEVFISDGAKSDCANIMSIFSPKSVIAVSDPVYPVYRDAALLSGKKVTYMNATEKNSFFPAPPSEHADLIFLCSPNNPTGAVATKAQLKRFVDYAIKHKAIILFDAAYSEFIRDASLPKSIYEIKGAKRCAIEIQSFSKSAGFTGVRLGWTVVPNDLVIADAPQGVLNQMWNRRQTTMFNGASNIAQEGGLAALSAAGQQQTRRQIAFYMDNARIIRDGLRKSGFTIYGGENAPYVWLKCPKGRTSWEFFDDLLAVAHVITTPGIGFGSQGEGYLRLSAFGSRKTITKAINSIQKHFARV